MVLPAIGGLGAKGVSLVAGTPARAAGTGFIGGTLFEGVFGDSEDAGNGSAGEDREPVLEGVDDETLAMFALGGIGLFVVGVLLS